MKIHPFAHSSVAAIQTVLVSVSVGTFARQLLTLIAAHVFTAISVCFSRPNLSRRP